MAQPNSVQREPSMEEILASIRRIIEDSDATRPNGAADGEASALPGADVLEVDSFRPSGRDGAEHDVAPLEVSQNLAALKRSEDALFDDLAASSETQANEGESVFSSSLRPTLDVGSKPSISAFDQSSRTARAMFSEPQAEISEPISATSIDVSAEAPEISAVSDEPVVVDAVASAPASEAKQDETAHSFEHAQPADQPAEVLFETDESFAVFEDLLNDELQRATSEDTRGHDEPVIDEIEHQAEALNVTAMPAAAEEANSDEPSRSALISEGIGRQVAASFDELSEAFAASRQKSFDEMAQEMLQPMLQDWLDNNLPTLVERLVREEIERIARGPAR